MRPNKLTLNKRSSGVLLHPTSLPGPYGVGDLGSEARAFVDFCAAAGQSWWQTFPIGPIGFGNSPYQTLSAFAGNPLLIGFDGLLKQKLLTPADIKPPHWASDRVSYQEVTPYKFQIFEKAFARFQKKKNLQTQLRSFLKTHRYWIHDYALFRAIKEQHNEAPWWEWDEPLRHRAPKALAQAEKRLAERVQFHKFLQWLFFEQWAALKQYAHHRGVGFIGDAPIFVSHDSSDVWAHTNLFHIDPSGFPVYRAGVPPDYFSQTGQLWGNPLYKWDVLKKKKYEWWVERFRVAFHLFDVVRLDHFIGYHRAWAVPAESATAEQGAWQKGPGAAFFQRVLKSLGPVEFIAEDLGLVTDEVRALRDQFQFPGMIVLQFAFGSDAYLQSLWPEKHPKQRVVYTGTHDNDTSLGWFQDEGGDASTRSLAQVQAERKRALSFLKTDGKEFHWDMMGFAMKSNANIAILPVQDILGLPSSARMNRPGTGYGNWEWRFKKGSLTPRLARRLKKLTDQAHRNN